MRKYYEAYDERYKTVHLKGVSWSSDKSTPVVLDIIQKYHISFQDSILEIGCGEGRDARAVLEKGYNLLATDISKEAIEYCKKTIPLYKDNFKILDCINNKHQSKYSFIYSVAVIHMLVLEEDRNMFYRFIYEHLTEDGIAMVCSMGTDIGGSATPIGASANVVGTSVAAKNGYIIGWGKYCKSAIPATIIVITISMIIIFIRYC